MHEERGVRVGLIGYPVEHSLSPAVYSKLFQEYSVNGSFKLIELESLNRNTLFEAIEELDAFAVTMPYKRGIISFLSAITECAAKIQSVNFVILKRENDRIKLMGDSTDGYGFLCGLKETGFIPKDKRVLIYGAGGAGAAVTESLVTAGADVYIAARDCRQAETLAKRLGATCVDSLNDMAGFDVDVFVNATPLGMHENADYSEFDFLDSLSSDGIVCDLVYKPEETRLLSCAKTLGLRTLNGLPMLKYQARAAFLSLLESLQY